MSYYIVMIYLFIVFLIYSVDIFPYKYALLYPVDIFRYVLLYPVDIFRYVLLYPVDIFPYKYVLLYSVNIVAYIPYLIIMRNHNDSLIIILFFKSRKDKIFRRFIKSRSRLIKKKDRTGT